MSKELRPIDIGNVPELLRLVEEVRKNEEPRLLRRDGEDLAVLTPLRSARKRVTRRVKTKEDYVANNVVGEIADWFESFAPLCYQDDDSC